MRHLMDHGKVLSYYYPFKLTNLDCEDEFIDYHRQWWLFMIVLFLSRHHRHGSWWPRGTVLEAAAPRPGLARLFTQPPHSLALDI